MATNFGRNRPRRARSQYLGSASKAGALSSLGQKWRGFRAGQGSRKLSRLQTLPRSRIRRILWHLNPQRLRDYWFTREGALMALKIGGIGILALFIFMLGLFAYFRKDVKGINDLSGNLGGSISYYDKTGKVLLFQDYDAVKRVPVASNAISPYMKQATVAIEDHNFYTEPGFSIKGIARAAFVDLLHHGSQQGGSTITEQLVKMDEGWTQNRTIARKVKELILAVDVERSYSKDDILTAYLNIAPYGGVDYGVQTAAEDYFHTTAAKLTLPQAAFLAVIPNSPSYYSPYSTALFDKQAFTDRYDAVLDGMVSTGAITSDQATAAKNTNILATVQQPESKYAGIQDPYFVLAAKNDLETNYIHANGSNGSSQVGGWKVITTLDVNLQNLANKAVQNDLPLIEAHNGDEAAFAAEDVKTGQMVALVGGRDFNAPGYGQINFAQWPISPGSSFKPYDYTTLINNNNAGAGSVLYDTTGPLPGYPCTNHASPLNGGNCLEDYDFRSPGPVTLRYALGGSRNIPAVKAMLESDPNDSLATDPSRTQSVNKVIQTADALMSAPNAYNCFSDAAMTHPTQCYGSSALGDGAFLHLDQHVNGLASLARLGQAIPSTYILQIIGSDNKPLYTWHQPTATQVVNPDAAYIVDNMASDPRASYLPGSCTTGANATCTPLSAGGYKFQRYNGWTNAVKTGTTGNSFDGLMTSWNTQYAAAAWVGYHTRNVALNTFMEILTEPITRTWMQGALDSLHTSPVNWTQPSDIQTLPAYVLTHKISSNGEIPPSPTTDIFPSWYKPRSGATSAVIDKVSGKAATDCTPDDAKVYSSGGNVNAFSIDIFYGNGIATNSSSTTAAGSDDVHQCSDAKPTISHIDVTPLGNGSYQLSATATAGTHPLTGGAYGGTISFAVDGTTVGTANIGSDGSASINYANTKYSGTHTLTATVTDSVLYQGTASRTVDFKKATASLAAGTASWSPGSPGPGGTITASWSGGSGPYTVTDNNNNQVCTTANTSCSGSDTVKPDSVTVTDSSGATVTEAVH